MTLAAADYTLERAVQAGSTPLDQKWITIGWKAHRYDSVRAENDALIEMAMIDKGVRERHV